jgi:poly-gamma-glutamate biosynthesis protein PgsC/CapC
MITIAIALGLLVGFILEQATGVVAGGLVVPGYLALYLDSPIRLGLTLVVALAAYLSVALLERHVILYGRRRAATVILVAFVIDWTLTSAIGQLAPGENEALAAIGHIVPGLLATNMVRTGPVLTVLGTTVVAIVVRLGLFIIGGGVSPL